MEIPSVPATFTKFPASLTTPFADVELSGETVDWEVEPNLIVTPTPSRERTPTHAT